jgi:hypothetical protein
MQEDDRNAPRVAGQLVIHLMEIIELEETRLIGLDRRIEIPAARLPF